MVLPRRRGGLPRRGHPRPGRHGRRVGRRQPQPGRRGVHGFTVDGAAQSATPGWSATLTDARWAHLAGHAGYVFPGGATVKALREARTGAWSDINKGAVTDPVIRRYLTLWFDHGTDPTWATYAYVLMPGATAERTAARAADTGWLTVLANSNDQQGVRVPSLGFTGVNFWFGGTVGDLTANAPASVMIRQCSSRPSPAAPAARLKAAATPHAPARVGRFGSKG
ncbi:polysaccharide lyase family 8 super-sandwich domain-containing protein [Streptomyces sp. HMX87]|uniref:polysaccharide lyase family 8 super-sandwich domain-containing protein n=1 Tax=Streptomyces sp. HMX87 TaxID=3390849 RepID=UPI003A84724C